MNIKAKLAGHYKSRFRTTAMMDDDIKNIKRLNALFAKFEKNDKEIYVMEILNVLKTLNNILYLERIILIMYELIEIKYHPMLDCLIPRVIGRDI